MTTRRKFLAGLEGIGTLGLAGCSAVSLEDEFICQGECEVIDDWSIIDEGDETVATIAFTELYRGYIAITAWTRYGDDWEVVAEAEKLSNYRMALTIPLGDVDRPMFQEMRYEMTVGTLEYGEDSQEGIQTETNGTQL